MGLTCEDDAPTLVQNLEPLGSKNALRPDRFHGIITPRRAVLQIDVHCFCPQLESPIVEKIHRTVEPQLLRFPVVVASIGSRREPCAVFQADVGAWMLQNNRIAARIGLNALLRGDLERPRILVESAKLQVPHSRFPATRFLSLRKHRQHALLHRHDLGPCQNEAQKHRSHDRQNNSHPSGETTEPLT